MPTDHRHPKHRPFSETQRLFSNARVLGLNERASLRFMQGVGSTLEDCDDVCPYARFVGP
jgi:hypothetical protein